ncbi:MAG TPA: lipid-binding SYLF domain-containing protein [Stellaceae bacterium]|nr:lipid-binding SYLF domain-containing protein [Stellaceae bacterium]
MIRRLVLSALFLAAIIASPLVSPARADNPPGHDQQILVNKAARVVAPMRSDPNFTYSGKLLAQAKAVLIVPELSKGGLIVGGQGGGAVLVLKRPDGSWSDPAFYSLGGGTLGLQAGFQTSQTVFFIMTDRARDQWINNQVKFGGQDGEGVFVVGQENKSSITQNNADVVAWSHATGAYGGINVEGTSISFDGDATAKYYGQPLTADQVFSGAWHNPSADRLRKALTSGK